MLIGLTYDLRDEYLQMGFTEDETAEFDREDTISSIENTLVSRLNQGDRWDLVFNIAEGMYGAGREAQVPALLDAYKIPYVFSGPLLLALTLDKALTKIIVRDAGVTTPDSKGDPFLSFVRQAPCRGHWQRHRPRVGGIKSQTAGKKMP